jgi:hypothetical protein
LDRPPLDQNFADNRLKKFFTWEMLKRDAMTGNQEEASAQEGEALGRDEAVDSAQEEVLGGEDPG